MAAGRGKQAVEMTGQGGFATAVGANDGHELTGHNGQVDPVQCCHFLILPIYIRMGQVFGFNNRFHNNLHKHKLYLCLLDIVK